MKKLNWIFLVAIMALASACGPGVDDDLLPTVDVSLNLKGAFGDELLLMRKDYQFDENTIIRFNRVSFYLSDVVFINDAEEETGVIDLELIDFTDFTEMNPGNADQGLSFLGTNIPVGDYTGLKMGLGVPADLNRLSPDDQSLGDGHPLTSSIHYWQGWQSYMFAMIEGTIDLNGNGTYETDESFKYHTGKDEAYETAYLLKSLSLTENMNPELAVTLDIKKIFLNADGSPVFDPSVNKNTHNPDDFPFIRQFMSYFSAIFSFS